MAVRLIKKMCEIWNPDDHHDKCCDALMAFIENRIEIGDSVDDVVRSDGGDEEEVTAGKEWWRELKFGGYRIIAVKRGNGMGCPEILTQH